ncbi:MAG TPA: C10 family peptidase [Bacteroidales bacterium]|nr:C10 family peptidase [Bacteroidales bacterium]
MKLKSVLLLMMLVFSSSMVFAKKVDVEEAKKIATRFYNEKYIANNNVPAVSFQVVETHIIQNEGTDVVYVFNFNNNGHAVVPADDVLYPVVGFSYTTSYDPETAPDNWKYVINNFGAQVEHVRKNHIEAAPHAAAAWANLRSEEKGDLSFLTNLRDIPIMLTSTWNQDYPYNYLCPPDPQGPGGHVYAGCVATAMSMIMYHWRFPYTGTGSKTYYAPGYGNQTANFGESYYNYEAMVNNTGNVPNYDVALLQYHCGVSVSMNYSPDGSGAYSQDVPAAIKNYFKYSNNAQYILRTGWPAWKAYLNQQMELLQPVYYSGQDGSGGHAFVVDGLQEQPDNNYYHFNFGWGGSSNGWYLAEDAGGFTSNNAMVRNFIPNETMYPYDPPQELVVLDFMNGTIEDGSGPKQSYQPNINSSWLIDPQNEYDSVSYIRLTFDRFETQEGVDMVKVYDGEDETAPLLGEFSGATIPAELYSTGNKVLITFTTNEETEANGWFISFKAFQPVWCSGLTSLTDPSGTFDDGSGSFYYNNGSTCMWTIQPEWASSTTISFNYFDTEADKDFLKVYDLQTQQLLANLSGNTVPEPITATSGKFYLVFTSNNANRGLGWEIYYEADNVGISENDEVFNHLSIYPNPAKSKINLSFISKAKDMISVSLLNMTGVEVYSAELKSNASAFAHAIDVSSLSKGVYILRLTSDEKEMIKKMIIE